MSRFARAAARLRRIGVTPGAPFGGATATYLTVNGYRPAHLGAAFAAGIIVAAGLAAACLTATDRWIATSEDRVIVRGVHAAGIDVASLSSADLAARLSYTPDEGRALVDATEGGRRRLSVDLADWLLTLPPDRRRDAARWLMSTATVIRNSPEKTAFVEATAKLDDPTAKTVIDAGADIGALLRRLAELSANDRALVIRAGWPIRPADDDRARLWAIVNTPDFPVGDLVPALSELARVHPERLVAVRKYIADGSGLPACRPVACTPMPCVSPWRDGYLCPPGHLKTVGPPLCVPMPRPTGRSQGQ